MLTDPKAHRPSQTPIHCEKTKKKKKNKNKNKKNPILNDRL